MDVPYRADTCVECQRVHTRPVWPGLCSEAELTRLAWQATFYALRHTYGFLSPELWRETRFQKSPLQEFTDFLAKPIVGDFKAVSPDY